MQTICPHCQTVFKVSNEHLKAADGYVRCGICKEVFNALETDLPAAKKEPAAQNPTAKTQAPVEQQARPGKTAATESKVEQKTEPPVAESRDTSPVSEAASDANAQPDLFTEPAETKKPNLKQKKATAVATETPIPKPESKPPVSKITAKPEPVAPIKEPEQTKAEAKPVAPAATPAKADSTGSKPESNMDNTLFEGVQSKLIPDEYRIPELHNTYSLWRDIAWSLAILALTATLFIEYIWFNRNDLISNPQLRPLVTQFCDMADCDLMELRELSEIEMITRNIYTHPNVKNALMISGTLINHAEFEQPYPDILIDFSDVRGEIIASRIFTPKDYLQIEATRLKPMAPKKSVDFNMEIQDPGKQAMTYEFSFL